MQSLIIGSMLISFFVVLFLTPWLMRYLRRIDLCVKDQNKENTPLVPISGGLSVFVGIFLGVLFFIFTETFFTHQDGSLLTIFAALLSLLIITLVGFMDDIIIEISKEKSGGLKQWQKPLLTLSAALPLIVINSGVSVMGLPLLGIVDVGLLYPLLFVPIGVVGAANMVNMLGGFNGLEAGMGAVYMGMLGAYAYVHERHVAALFAFLTFAALLAFLLYNKVPAKILPGDSLTYLLGGALASIAILGNIEKAALIVSIPFIIEFFLKMRSRFKADSFGYFKDGKIHSRHNKIYSLTHIFTRTGKYTEKQIVFFFILIELFFSSFIWVL